jgi:uncharacterized protein YjbI with pentapeptide repeats
MNEIIIGNKLAEERKARGFSQEEFAETLCVSKQAVGKWERGESLPDIIMLSKIAESFGKDLNYFDGSTEDEKDNSKNNDNDNDNNGNGETNENEKRMAGYPKRKLGLSQWKEADLSGITNVHSKMGYSNIEKCKFLDTDLSSVIFKANNLQENDFTGANFTKTQFRFANVDKNNFTNANLTDSIFKSSNIDNNTFTGADFTRAIFSGCNFDNNNLTKAVLNAVEFSKCKIKKNEFTGEITNCSFADCKFSKVVFCNAILKNVFIKCKNMKSVIFENCKADKLTVEFLRISKADISNITIIE